jgi:hypothetical protein
MPVSAAASALVSFTRAVSAPPIGAPAKPQAGNASAQSEADMKSATTQQQKNRLEELQAQFRDKVMHQRNLSDKVMADMTAGARADVEASIRTEASQMMQSALEGQAQGDAGQNQPATATVLDIKV